MSVCHIVRMGDWVLENNDSEKELGYLAEKSAEHKIFGCIVLSCESSGAPTRGYLLLYTALLSSLLE